MKDTKRISPRRMLLKRRLVIYIFVITALGVVLIAGCSTTRSQEKSSIDSASISRGDPLASLTEDRGIKETGITEINIKAFRFGFEPNTIRVKAGEKVRLTAESIDVPHGLTIDKYGINLYLDGVESSSVEFIADKKGKFPIYCSVYCGRGHSSMRGVLIVE